LSFEKVARVTSHHLYYSMCSKCPPPTQTQARMLKPVTIRTFNNRAAQSGPFVADASFQFLDVKDST